MTKIFEEYKTWLSETSFSDPLSAPDTSAGMIKSRVRPKADLSISPRNKNSDSTDGVPYDKGERNNTEKNNLRKLGKTSTDRVLNKIERDSNRLYSK